MLACAQRRIINHLHKQYDIANATKCSFNSVRLLVLLIVASYGHGVDGRLPTAAETSTPSTYIPPAHIRDKKVVENRSKDVLKYINLRADPCFDFYEFACGDWSSHNPVHPPSNESLTQEILLQHFIDQELQNILEEAVVKQDESITERQLREFYKSCMTADRNGVVQQTFFSEFIKRYHGFPAVPGAVNKREEINRDYDWQQTIAQLHRDYGMNILIGIEVNPNPAFTKDTSLFLSEPSTIIPPDLCNFEATRRIDIQHLRYNIIETEVADNLRAWLTIDKDTALRIAADIVSFEYELCVGMQVNVSNVPGEKPTEYRTHNEFTYLFNQTINFNELITTVFDRNAPKRLYMKSKPYFDQLVKVVGENNSTTLANYIMYQALSMLAIPQSTNIVKRPKYCLGVIKRYLSDFLGDMYVQRNLATQTQAKDDLLNIFANLRNAMDKSLQRDWIEYQTTVRAQTKLQEINVQLLGNNKRPMNGTFDLRNYWQNLARVMSLQQQNEQQRLTAINGVEHSKDKSAAYETIVKYRSAAKRIDVGGGLLQEPFYHYLYPNSMRYAILGQMMGRELAKAFDDTSWVTPYLGIENWNSNTQTNYSSRAECFRQQMSNYLHNDPNGYHNQTHVRELISMVSGLNLAFDAYLQWLHFKSPNNDFVQLRKETLPDMNFSNTQLFFIAFAQNYCISDATVASTAGRKTKTEPVISLLHRHTVQRYWVNGPLQNSADFALDFGCPVGSQMNPSDKCVIY